MKDLHIKWDDLEEFKSGYMAIQRLECLFNTSDAGIIEGTNLLAQNTYLGRASRRCGFLAHILVPESDVARNR
jgi:hypothetical protein